ncbi:MAG: gfo/Idh/MocA family oxidoreductase [Verrucomicrobia bacterium]|nr:MAG: gfo/Idh/MocA family oxidoreductase [Verrucomicrobiota bacterium]
MVNVGVIGLGFMGLTHLKAYQQVPGARLVAVCDAVRLPEDGNLQGVAGNIASHNGVHLDMSQVKGYRDYHDMLANPDVQLVDICVPTPLHAPMSLDALAAGKHVICEKPLARDTATCRKIVEAAAAASTFFMPAMCLRFWPEWSWLKDAIESGRYGRVLSATFERLSEPPGWSQGSYFKGSESGGALLDMHIHDTDFVQFCFGRPKSVFATGQSRFSGAVDHVNTIYEVEGGASVTAEGSWLMHKGFGFKMGFRVNFEEATAIHDSTRPDASLVLYREGGEPRIIQPPGGDGYIGELAYMIECIEQGRAPSIVTAEDGMAAVAICEAEERSVASRRPEPVVI